MKLMLQYKPYATMCLSFGYVALEIRQWDKLTGNSLGELVGHSIPLIFQRISRYN